LLRLFAGPPDDATDHEEKEVETSGLRFWWKLWYIQRI